MDRYNVPSPFLRAVTGFPASRPWAEIARECCLNPCREKSANAMCQRFRYAELPQSEQPYLGLVRVGALRDTGHCKHSRVGTKGTLVGDVILSPISARVLTPGHKWHSNAPSVHPVHAQLATCEACGAPCI